MFLKKKIFGERSQIDKNWTRCFVQGLLSAKTLVQFKSVKLIFKHAKNRDLRVCWDPSIEGVKNYLIVENVATFMTYFCNCTEFLDCRDLGFEYVQIETLYWDHVKNRDFRVSRLLRLGSRICWLSIISQLSNLGL